MTSTEQSASNGGNRKPDDFLESVSATDERYRPTGALEGKTVLVTGAARGLGACITKCLASDGATVVLGDILVERGQAIAQEIGSKALFLHLDVTDQSSWAAFVEEAVSRFGSVDGLVNNAAVLHVGTLENTPLETFRKLVDVNTVGPFLGTRAVLPAMNHGTGSIVHISSIDGLKGMNGVTAYAASKWGLRGLSKASAMELGRSGIRVNTICPSSGGDEIAESFIEKLVPIADDIVAEVESQAIPRQVPPVAVASAVTYLLSDASKHVTGIDLPVDAGATAGRFLPGFNTL